jgi:hypothetical protein
MGANVRLWQLGRPIDEFERATQAEIEVVVTELCLYIREPAFSFLPAAFVSASWSSCIGSGYAKSWGVLI